MRVWGGGVRMERGRGFWMSLWCMLRRGGRRVGVGVRWRSVERSCGTDFLSGKWPGQNEDGIERPAGVMIP